MPLRRILPYVAIVLVGQAVLDAGPAIVAEREGGMGLGSALIGALVTQIAGIVLGATLAGHVVDRRSPGAALLSGAFLYYVGLLTTGIAPMGSLGTVVVGMGVAGIGFGGMLTAAFSVAAAIEPRRARAAAVVLLLAAPIAARVVVGTAFAAGPPAFVVAGAAIVALALVAVRASPTSRPPLADPLPSPRSVGPSALAGAALAIGTMLAVAGADPSRLSATLIAGTLGLSGFDSIDATRAVLFATGLALVLVGAGVLLAASDRVPRLAGAGLLLVAIAGSGIAAALTQATTAGRMPDAASALTGVATLFGGLLGLAIGGTLLARGHGDRPLAVAGGAALTVVCALGGVTLLGQRPEPGDVLPIVLLGIGGLALGVAASVLRLALTDVDPSQRGLGAGAGVVAAVIGSALGGLIGAGEGLSTLGGEGRGVPIGLLGFVIAAAVAVVVAAALPREGHPGRRRASEGDRLSQTPR